MSGNRVAILERARELFNAHGLEAVGVRELARDLGLSPGNVSYHFPHKQDLVMALMAEHGQRNAERIAALAAADDIAAFLEGYRGIFRGQHDYRFLLRSVVYMVEAYPEYGARYAETDRVRRSALLETFRGMVGRDLRPETDSAALARIVGTCTLVSRFWSAEMRLSFEERDIEQVIGHYLALVGHAIYPAATEEARRLLTPYLEAAIE